MLTDFHESNPSRFRASRFLLGTLATALAAFAIACSSSSDNSATATKAPPSSSSPSAAATTSGSSSASPCPPAGASASNSLSGAGSTFIAPLFTKWVDEYQKVCGTKINYNAVGSGAGIQQITAKTVDFGASDGILSDQQEKDAVAASGAIIHIAMTSGSEAVIFNLPGVSKAQLKLDGPTLADIYLGNIKKWNDPKLTALNPGVNLPNTDIAVVHRSDGSGTTFIFANYLSKVSPDWQSKVGFATSVNWPAGVGGAGNDGVAGQVKQLPGAIGYVELAYAVQNNLPWAQMKNKSGAYLEPTLAGTTAAAQGSIPADMKLLITDSADPKAYPIAGFSWVLAYVNQPDAAKGKALSYYLWWAIHDGQRFSTDLNYGPLSSDVVKAAEAQIEKLQCGGSACYSTGR